MPFSLAERLRQQIRREGAITFHDWMKAALYDADGGYYQQPGRERWGREGDYRTSPERSELFAATFAGYFAQLSAELDGLTIVECGAGAGHFAAGVLGTLRDQFPSVFLQTRYVICELSDDARRRTRERLVEFGNRVEIYEQLVAIDSGIYFANELLDAFPVHRVEQTDAGLMELYVTVDANGEFQWTTGPLSTPRLAEFCNQHSIELEPEQIIEINLEIDDWLAAVAGKLRQGFLITIDYGADPRDLYDKWMRPDGTLRGFSRHSFVENVLAQPGEYDLTTTVNWAQVIRTSEQLGFQLVEFASQDKFLLRAGLLGQLEKRLSKAESDADRVALTTGAREMILIGGMASSFQVFVQRRASL